MQNGTVNDSSNTEEGIDYQDIALAYLTSGLEGVVPLYLTYAIPPAMSMEMWSLLYRKGAARQELAIFLVYVHAPLSTVARG